MAEQNEADTRFDRLLALIQDAFAARHEQLTALFGSLYTTNVIATHALSCYSLGSILWSCSLWLITSRFSRRFSLHSALAFVASACCSDDLAIVPPLAYQRTLA
jgi:predicted MFS family arabinose efflux permease